MTKTTQELMSERLSAANSQNMTKDGTPKKEWAPEQPMPEPTDPSPYTGPTPFTGETDEAARLRERQTFEDDQAREAARQNEIKERENVVLQEKERVDAENAKARAEEVAAKAAAAADSPVKRDPAMRTFKHPNAGSSVIMDNGRRLVFVGPVGGPGYCTTAFEDEIKYMEAMVKTPGTMITHEEDPTGQVDEGVDVYGNTPLAASRSNTMLEVDPNVRKARDNMGANIMKR